MKHTEHLEQLFFLLAFEEICRLKLGLFGWAGGCAVWGQCSLKAKSS